MSSILEKELAEETVGVTAKEVNSFTLPEINTAYDTLPEQISGWKTMNKKAKTEAIAEVMNTLGLTIEGLLDGAEEAKAEMGGNDPITLEQVATADDKLTKVAQEIESINKEKDAIQYALDLVENEGMNEFKLGGIFSVILTHAWKGDTKETYLFITDTFEIGKRKAQYCVAMYNSLVNAELSWNHVKSIGWTKLKEITDIITLDTIDFWIEKANEMNIDNFKAFVKQHKKELAGDTSEPIVSNIITKTLKFHEDQAETYTKAIEKSKEASGTEVDSVAIENICLDFLGAPVAAQSTPKEQSPSGEVVVDAKTVSKFLGGATNTQLKAFLPIIFNRMHTLKPDDGEALNALFETFSDTFPYDLEFTPK